MQQCLWAVNGFWRRLLAYGAVLAVCFAMSIFAPVLVSASQGQEALASLGQIDAAMREADLPRFEEHVNSDALVSQCLDYFLAEMRKPENSAELPPMLALLFAQGGDSSLRALLKNEALAFLRNGVASGAFGGKPNRSVQNQGLIAPLFANASLGRKELRAAGEPSQAEKGGWLLPIILHDYGNERDYPILGRFDQRGQRLEGIENLPELFNILRLEALSQ